MNPKEILDDGNDILYLSQKIQFSFGVNYFIISKTRFRKKELKRFNYSSITHIEHFKPNKSINVLRKIIGFVFVLIVSFISETFIGDTEKEAIKIHYLVDGEDAIYTLEIKVTSKDFNLVKNRIMSYSK